MLFEIDKVECFFGRRRHPSKDRSFPFQHVAFPPFFDTPPIYEVHRKLADKPLKHAQNPKASVAKNVSTPLSLARERTVFGRMAVCWRNIREHLVVEMERDFRYHRFTSFLILFPSKVYKFI